MVAHLAGREGLTRHVRGPLPPAPLGPDLGDVVGQAAGRRAVEVAAAGGHHLFLTGPPSATYQINLSQLDKNVNDLEYGKMVVTDAGSGYGWIGQAQSTATTTLQVSGSMVIENLPSY